MKLTSPKIFFVWGGVEVARFYTNILFLITKILSEKGQRLIWIMRFKTSWVSGKRSFKKLPTIRMITVKSVWYLTMKSHRLIIINSYLYSRARRQVIPFGLEPQNKNTSIVYITSGNVPSTSTKLITFSICA